MIDRLTTIMARLRDPDTGCEWDRVQTSKTIARYTIEEAYEVVDAIESAAPTVAGTVFWEEGQLPFPASLEGRLLERLIGPITLTPLTDGVQATIEHFRSARA